MDVLTEDKLAQLLSSIGIHSEDIQSAISDSHAHATPKGITSLQNIASKAIANTASRIAQSKDEESVGVWPPTRLKKDWRHQEDTILIRVRDKPRTSSAGKDSAYRIAE
ncbi:MAG: hypothetical protein CL693_00250 [Cellvibrionaceae bacterium]|nr:hypothetical protein [Cellvibrionaceae bacterium]|tara:strand:+ start:232 stop:558 length:327 start_codon:yes stop_codon:yes gene_type:complete